MGLYGQDKREITINHEIPQSSSSRTLPVISRQDSWSASVAVRAKKLQMWLRVDTRGEAGLRPTKCLPVLD